MPALAAACAAITRSLSSAAVALGYAPDIHPAPTTGLARAGSIDNDVDNDTDAEDAPLLPRSSSSPAPSSLPSQTALSFFRRGYDASSTNKQLAPVRSSASLSSAIVKKGKCWCCWEMFDDSSNPLIRVCLGCLDPDLQWIHQRCIDNYLSLLPLPRGTPPDALPDFKCTRCGDPYTVISTPVPRWRVIWNDRFLFAAFVVMSSCILVLAICCVSLLVENWGTGNLLIDWEIFAGFRISISIVSFAFVMFFVCHVLNACTLWIMFDFAKGRSERHVQGIPTEQILTATRQYFAAPTNSSSSGSSSVSDAGPSHIDVEIQ
ncbi:hypothetical protein HDU83_001697 [Entophlyctis luteolus]|nr:hypothetical protein HDU83_001697 [Entophlyctis luteolus]